METMNIALPESMKHFVQERGSEGGYSIVSEYVRELIRADQKRKAEDRIDALLVEALDSGEPIPVTKEHWEEKKSQVDRGQTKRDRSNFVRLRQGTTVPPSVPCPPPGASGRLRHSHLPGSIGILEAPDKPMPIGIASAIGRTEGSLAVG